MGIVSTGAGQNFITELYALTATAFQKKCFEHLSEVFPELRNAAELRGVDREGIDIYQLSTSTQYDYNLAFQCKGLEKRFDKSQYDQCINSLNSLRRSGKKVNKYYMVLNLKSKYFDLDLKRDLINKLQELVIDKIAKSAELLDAEGFTLYVSRLILDKLHGQVSIANKRFFDDYIHSMNQKFYYEEVPYSINKKIQNNPTEYILSKTTEKLNDISKPIGKNWFFVISEFGFGKTSLLFHLSKKLKADKYRCLYIPASLFQKDDFQYPISFGNRLLEIIENRVINFENSFTKLSSKLVSYLFQSENNQTILMIDGLDEHEELFKQDVLKTFFRNISPFKCPIIFTIRKEMWDERHGNFESALGKGNEKSKVKLMLEEWQNKDILSYIAIYHQSTARNSIADKNISNFKQLIEKGEYEKYYGDIPKRPLFLEMLISDIKINKIQKRNISEIYLLYLRNKFLIDRQGAFASHGSKRPLTVDEDVNKILSLIFTALSRIANKMIIGLDANNRMILSTYIEENKIEQILAEANIPKTVELTLHSVLVPLDVRVNDNMSLKFAHKSFQEFFFARAILNHIRYCISVNEKISDLNTIHSEGVNQFITGFLENEFSIDDLEKIRININNHYSDISHNTIAESILKICS